MKTASIFFSAGQGPAVYPDSPSFAGDSVLAMVRTETGDRIASVGPVSSEFVSDGTAMMDGETVTLSPLTHGNAAVLRRVLPFTAPSQVLTRARTIGLGDRLGLAGDGHIALLKKHADVFPILAQQSMRELSLTERTFEDVLDSATFAVFRQGFRRGWGADGDHLKNAADIRNALDIGYTMITLDCGEHIRTQYADLSDEDAAEQAARLGIGTDSLRPFYAGTVFSVEGNEISYTEGALARLLLVYGDMLEFATEIYHTVIAPHRGADFEISIDEVMNPTSPAEHFFIASELIRRGVRPATVAPRFCGEFQKGIDYIGDPAEFEREMAVHAAIARRFGYKISVHSGSDKFSVFPAVNRQTRGVFHVKTAGTNYLEAMRIVAEKEPALYRALHSYALEHFNEATRYYHVTTDLSKIPDIRSICDAELPGLFGLNDARQLIHICYGVLLTARKPDGSFLFRDDLYTVWDEYRAEYAAALDAHIGRHLELLGC